MAEFEKRYKKLNKQQKKAVDTTEGPVLVVAGPGSGKTEILGLRVANILKRTDVFPSNILCLTFTDSASVNMRERLKELIGSAAYQVAIHTFHSFGERIKNSHPEIFYKGAVFNSIDTLTQLDIIERIFDKLEYDDPLKSKHSEMGYIYSKPVSKTIQYLKKAGITPEEFKEILDHNKKSLKKLNPIIEKTFTQRISKSILEELPPVVKKIEKIKVSEFPVEHMKPLPEITARSLGRASTNAIEEESTSYITEWKKDWTYKSKDGKRKMRESKYMDKMYSLAKVYKEYQERMLREGYYDFDDMILDVVKAIKENDELRYDIQEQFQYILVDEFQDTNDAQMRLLNLLTGSGVQEGKPNIMAVGDDDQAIFKFQGAQISNIVKFKENFRDPEIITMVKNYRSRQEILNVARHVITQGEERLENLVDDIDKKLEAQATKESGDIISKTFPTQPHEYYWIAQEIKRLIEEENVEKEEIAVISRKHKYLQELVPYVAKLGIPISYEKQRNVLKEPHIKQIIQIARYINSLLDTSVEDADHLLPEILSYPFWDLDREVIWKLSRKAFKERKTWLSCMKESSNEQVNEIADFLLDLASYAEHQPLEKVLDKIVGAEVHVLSDSEDEDIEESEKEKEFKSSFKKYYFSHENFKKEPATYITFLSSLRTFIYALREHKQGKMLKLPDLIEFVDTHKANNMPLTDKSVFTNARKAVNLLSAHKAKGMEFNTVFVLSCQDSIWARAQRGSRLPFPKNLPIKPAGDNKDDQLRLFYVAISRAAKRLYLTSFETDQKGKETSRLEFITPPEENEKVKEDLNPDQEELEKPKVEENIISSSWEIYHHPPFEEHEEVLLETVLKNYKLNPTHLNNFLDVTRGGPRMFLKQNLLRFPQPKTPPLSFGTAMHRTMHQIYVYLKKKDKLASEKQVIQWFKEFLRNERMSENEFETYFKKGKDALKIFYKKKKKEFDPSHFSEFNFRNESVAVEDIPLTGKIDKIVLKNNKAGVHDFKTGSPVEKWKGKSAYEKVKLWKYKNQLILYKLLIENSQRFQDYEVNKGIVEFLEPNEDKEVVDLPLEIEENDINRIKELIKAVYNKVMNLDFPPIDQYQNSISGIKKFEKDLLKGNI